MEIVMNESSKSLNVLDPPPPSTGSNGTAVPSAPGWIRRIFPTFFVMAALASLAYWGHHTGWTMPSFAALTGNGVAESDDWCAEHGVPESQCVECQSDLMPKGKEFGWCKVHGVSECPFEHR